MKRAEKLKRQYSGLFKQLGEYGPDLSMALFTNQTAFDFSEGKYLAQLLMEKIRLSMLLVPEHGFFTELQDQETVDLQQGYPFLPEDVELVSLYRQGQKGFHLEATLMERLDLVIIDIQDIGSRYYTYVTTMAQLLKAMSTASSPPDVILVDHPNLAGRQVEGTPLPPDYTSLIGWEGIPHRYGLTLGELALFIKDQVGGTFNLKILSYDPVEETEEVRINPSPNIPQPATMCVFTGQCLFEGTNVSEGRGTTRPFEIFGAPFFSKLPGTWLDKWNREHSEAVLRPLIFYPTFHKYAGQLCSGLQLHPVKKEFHSLWYSLKLIRELNRQLDDFQWLEGPYESGSDRKAIEILVGDPLLIKYLYGKYDEEQIRESLIDQEQTWIEKASPYLLYDLSLKKLLI